MTAEKYGNIGWCCGAITFLISWWVCFVKYGFLWGFGFGWVPSIILAYIVGFTWPVVGFGLAIFALSILK